MLGGRILQSGSIAENLIHLQRSDRVVRADTIVRADIVVSATPFTSLILLRSQDLATCATVALEPPPTREAHRQP